jgi:hypothetical protein
VTRSYCVAQGPPVISRVLVLLESQIIFASHQNLTGLENVSSDSRRQGCSPQKTRCDSTFEDGAHDSQVRKISFVIYLPVVLEMSYAVGVSQNGDDTEDATERDHN